MKIGLVYYGGQYNHLILKNLKYLGADVEVVDTKNDLEYMKKFDCVVFSGGPYSVKDEINKMGNSPLYVKELQIPKLGICLGHQLLAYVLGGKVGKAENPEFGLARIKIVEHDTILQGLKTEFNAWESHNDEVKEVPPGFVVLASSKNTKIEAMANKDQSIYGVQFHPEVKHTENGIEIFKNFLTICKK
ncbi:GMP synthase subunit A [Acidianus sulfidivorans JP7]|uniref:GMP synthase [glutamine-hydrolyzing] subunit A n=1 Tax=Acidianus sulfidivorans JP7 TaxID=619593 RepID=A0A2U9IK50_9CREN|nr:GMP synthase subunit A [Acidianus sulfidivorans]AWR96390.1 GMP synthase subunit A [Acidianus sulfidivorans JP7]